MEDPLEAAGAALLATPVVSAVVLTAATYGTGAALAGIAGTAGGGSGHCCGR